MSFDFFIGAFQTTNSLIRLLQISSWNESNNLAGYNLLYTGRNALRFSGKILITNKLLS